MCGGGGRGRGWGGVGAVGADRAVPTRCYNMAIISVRMGPAKHHRCMRRGPGSFHAVCTGKDDGEAWEGEA